MGLWGFVTSSIVINASSDVYLAYVLKRAGLLFSCILSLSFSKTFFMY